MIDLHSPVVSIVIPAYNAQDFIRDSVQSALDQTLKRIEVIVVDDGSQDSTAAVVNEIADPRVKLLKQSNSGQSAAANRGANAASGQFIKFFDADDWMNPFHIESQLEAVQHSPGSVASCRWGFFNESPTVSYVRTEHTNKDYDNPVDWIVDSLHLDEGMMGGWMWLIPRELLVRSGGWNESLTLNNDFDFSIRILLASSGVRFAKDAVYSYREGVKGAMTGARGETAMKSLARTTELGCAALLEREDSARTRCVCADRWQKAEYVFFPDFIELADEAARHVASLGGSDFRIEGGRLLRVFLKFTDWRTARRLQSTAHRLGWHSVARWKTNRRIQRIRAGLE